MFKRIENHFRMKKKIKIKIKIKNVHVELNAIDGIKQKWWTKDARVFLD